MIIREAKNISVAEAIKTYTINASYALRQDEKVSALEVGKEADFIIFKSRYY